MKMKRAIAAVLVVLLGILMTACTKKDDTQTREEWLRDAMPQIYDIAMYADPENNNYNRTNILAKQPYYTLECHEGSRETFRTERRDIELAYERSIYYLDKGEKTRRYHAVGCDDSIVWWNGENMDTFTISNYVIETLSFSVADSEEEIRAAAETALSDLADFSVYQIFKMSKDDLIEDGHCYLRYSNEVNGYETDCVSVEVCADGKVTGVTKRSIGRDVTDLCNSVDKELEEALINAKLKDIFSTESTEYLGEFEIDDAEVRILDGEVHIYYSLWANVKYEQPEYEHKTDIQIMIPAELMLKK